MKHFKSPDFATITKGETYMVLSEYAKSNTGWSFMPCDAGQTEAEVIDYLINDCSDRFFVTCTNYAEGTVRDVTEDVVRKTVETAEKKEMPLREHVYNAALSFGIDAISPDEWEDYCDRQYSSNREHERLESMGRL